MDRSGRAAGADSRAAKAKWEAPLALARPKPPAASWKNWTGALDRFTAAYLVKHGIGEPQLVSDAVFARRAYLDIWGLLPRAGGIAAHFWPTGRPTSGSGWLRALLADNRKVRGELDLLLERPAAQRRRRELLLRNGADARASREWLLAALENEHALQPVDRRNC